MTQGVTISEYMHVVLICPENNSKYVRSSVVKLS